MSRNAPSVRLPVYRQMHDRQEQVGRQGAVTDELLGMRKWFFLRDLARKLDAVCIVESK